MKITHNRLLEVLDYSKTTGDFTWRIPKKRIICGTCAGSAHGEGYIEIGIDHQRYLAHRLAWFYVTGKWPAKDVDHKNHIRNDNRWKNLRRATRSQNLQHCVKSANRSSRFIGVSYDKDRSKWCAYVSLNKNGKLRCLHVGRFSTEDAAARARDKKVRELGLTWKTLNFGRGHRALKR